MTTMEMNAMKLQLIQSIADTDNMHLLSYLESALERFKKKQTATPARPCVYTQEEQEEILRQSLADDENGLGISSEELKEEMKTW